jgi:signal transduction histidine kinase
LIFKTGFPGAMISLMLENENDKWVVSKGKRGSRFEKIPAQAKWPLAEDSLLSRIARGQEPPLICDSRIYFDQEMAVLKESKIVSQYIVPLKNIQGDTIAFLQIDLGDARYKDCLQDSEKRVLDSVGASVESTIARLINRVEANTARELDEALQKSLPAESISEALQRYLESAVRIFGADMGHIRLERPEDHALVMIAGTGPYYEAFRQMRSALAIDDDSPTRQAFSGETLVVNDAPSNNWLQKQCKQYQNRADVMAVLKQIGSYANVVFRDERGKPIGTINLVSRQPWFFTRAQVRSLEAMGQRVGFLLGHLRRHINLQFLQNVGTDFVRTANFEEPLGTLAEATERYCKAANADVACLYLWDDEVEQFILRAEYGWAVPGWVDAARYGRNDHWTGRVALAGGPQYIPDLYAYKREQGIEPRFARKMFGAELSEEFAVEALGLPLKLRDKDVGVLTLYRRVRPARAGRGDGFTTTDTNVLQRAADNLATMVNAQLYYLQVRWERDEARRHEEVCSALDQPDKDHSLEEIMCLQMLRSFRAKQVSFYLTNATRGVTAPTWVAGFRRCQSGEEALQPAAPDDLIQRAVVKELVEKLHEIPTSGWDDPEVVKKSGWIERVCLPLRDGSRVIGVLDVHWSTKRRQLRPLLTPHNPEELIELGQEIGAAYQRQKRLAQQKEAKMQAERNGLAAQTMGVMLFQSAHRLMNLVQDLHAMPDLIADVESEQERHQRIEELSQLINSAVDKIKGPMDIASRTRQIVPQLCNLRGLLAQVLSDLGTTPTVEVRWKIPESMVAWADENLVKEAFRNIIRNAMQAMTGGGVLDLRAELIPDVRNVRVTFADTGSGMSKDEVKAALSGFVSTRGGTGLGVLVSLLLIRANNGDLKIKSRKGEGTQIIVTLPVEPTREAL